MAGYQGSATRKDFMEFIAGAVESGIREVNTTFDATVVSYDRSTQLATIQPKLKRRFGDKELTAPPLEKIRIAMPSGGPDGVHFDLKPGDPLVAHARMRNTDTSQGDGTDANASPGRMHDLSDVIAYPGGGPDTSKMDNMPAGGTHFGKKNGKSGFQARADGSSAVVGGPSGADKLVVSASGKIDIKSESGDSLLDIVKAALVLIRDHLNSGAPVDSATQVAANQLIAKVDGMKA